MKIKLLNKRAKVPVYKHKDDAGADLFAPDDAVIPPKSPLIIDVSVAFEVPKNHFLAVVSRSGLAAKRLVTVLNGIGIIDIGFQDSIKIILYNHGARSYRIAKGDRIAQAILIPYKKAKFKIVSEFKKSTRGKSGLGSTGK